MDRSDVEPVDRTPDRDRARPGGRWRRLALIAGLTATGLLVALELILRLIVGLGDPPLWVAHETIEYLPAPSHEFRRFGNRVAYNAYSMRSSRFPRQKQDPNELRVICFGDSVLNGGGLTDQSELATERIELQLATRFRRPVVVGNVSAGSWGPANMLAYAETFGFFDADVVIIVLSSHDHVDVPTFEPVVGVRPGFPAKRPILALQELFGRYLVRSIKGRDIEDPTEVQIDPEAAGQSLSALGRLIRLAQAHRARVIVALYPGPQEVIGQPLAGYEAILTLTRQMSVASVQMIESFGATLAMDVNPYRDHFHPNATGQRLLADALFAAVAHLMAPAGQPVADAAGGR